MLERQNAKVWIIYDCPCSKCSKNWIVEELIPKNLDVRGIYSPFEISQVEQKGTIGKLIARAFTLFMCIIGAVVSKKDDTVICWSNMAGLYFNLLPGSQYKDIISCNWLTPTPRKSTLFLYQRALQNRRLTAIINSRENKEKLLKEYQVDNVDNICYIPDVYDSSQEFILPHITEHEEERYCFMGGRANRDWKLFLDIARELPTIRFVGVSASADWNTEFIIPDNVSMYFDLPAKQYYSLLHNSYLAIYPLKDNRVAGLVNIVKAIQIGKLVLVTDIPATRMYYTPGTMANLIEMNHKEQWIKRIEYVYSGQYTSYCKDVQDLQQHLQNNFSPQMAGEELHHIIIEQKRKKIFFLTAGMIGGGTERVISVLANAFVRTNRDIEIIMTANHKVDYVLDTRIGLTALGSRTGGSIIKRIKRISSIRSIIKQNRNAIFISFGTETNLYSILAGIGLPGKMIVSERNDPNQCGYKGLRDFIYRYADCFVFQTKAAAKCFSEKMQGKSFVIANPISDNLPQIYREERRKTICAVGRLTSQKNYPLLLKSFGDFHSRHPEYDLEIYGKGELEQELVQLTAQLGLVMSVHFMGFCEDVLTQIRDCSMYVISSDYEGISNSLVEAMGMGLPVVATDCPIGGSSMCIQDGVNGYLVPVENEKALSEAMCAVIEKPEITKALAVNAAKVRESFSVERIVEEWLQVME